MVEGRIIFERRQIEFFGVTSPQGTPEAHLKGGVAVLRKFEMDSVSRSNVCWEVSELHQIGDWIGYELGGELVNGLTQKQIGGAGWVLSVETASRVIFRVIDGLSRWAVMMFIEDIPKYSILTASSLDGIRDALSAGIRNNENAVILGRSGK